MAGLKVLITNGTMNERHGSVTFIRDLTLGLLAAGHLPILYSPDLGEMPAELRTTKVPVVDDLADLGVKPDVIHGNSHCDTMTALLRLPGVPAVFTCHSRDCWLAEPPRFPRLRRYIAVDQSCREWLIGNRGFPARCVRVLFNGIDRTQASFASAVENLVDQYRDVIKEQAIASASDAAQESVAAASYLLPLHNELERLRQEVQVQQAQLDNHFWAWIKRLTNRAVRVPTLRNCLRVPIRMLISLRL